MERVALARTAVAQGARRLLAAANGRLIGLVGPNLSVAVASELKGSGATLLAVDTGANVIRADEESPQVITHSLGLWRGAVALGAWAARQYGPRGLVLSGIVESGYDMLHAFEIGLTEAEGHLGYEAGLLAAAEQQGIDGPRGWIRPGPLGATRFPLYLRKVVGQSNQVLGAVPAPAENAPAMAALRSAVRTGWVTPYLV